MLEMNALERTKLRQQLRRFSSSTLKIDRLMFAQLLIRSITHVSGNVFKYCHWGYFLQKPTTTNEMQKICERMHWHFNQCCWYMKPAKSNARPSLNRRKPIHWNSFKQEFLPFCQHIQ